MTYNQLSEDVKARLLLNDDPILEENIYDENGIIDYSNVRIFKILAKIKWIKKYELPAPKKDVFKDWGKLSPLARLMSKEK